MAEQNNSETYPKRDFEAIKIMADCADGYAWTIRDVALDTGGGCCSPLAYYFPNIPEVEEIDKALLDWSMEFSMDCGDFCDLRFDFVSLHEEGVALAERLARAIKQTGIRVFYERPYEDPNTSPMFEVGEGIARPPQRLFEILDRYRNSWTVDSQTPAQVDYFFKAAELPAIEQKIRESIEIVIGKNLADKIIDVFHKILNEGFSDEVRYEIPLIWGDKYDEAPGGGEFFYAIRTAFMALAGGKFADFLRWFTAYPGVMNFCPSSMAAHIESTWRSAMSPDLFDQYEDLFLWIFIGGARSGLYHRTRDIDFADAAGYLLWDILQDYKVPEEDGFAYILRDEREGKQCDHAAELIRRFKAGLIAIRSGKYRREIENFCSEEEIGWIGRWRNDDEWAGSDDPLANGIAEVVRKRVVESIEYYSGAFWKRASEWGNELVEAIRQYVDAGGQGKIRIKEDDLKKCIESKVLYDRALRSSAFVKSYLNSGEFSGSADYVAACLINEIMKSGAIVFEQRG